MICGADCASAEVGNAEGGNKLGAMTAVTFLKIDIVYLTLAVVELRNSVTTHG